MAGLMRRGHSAELVCREREPFAAEAARGGIVCHLVRPRGELDPACMLRVARVIRSGGYDVVHAHTAHAHALAAGALALTPRRARPPLVVSRRVDFSLHKLPFRLSLLKYRWGVSRFIAISECVKQVMVGDGLPADRIRVVNSGVDPARYEGVNADGLRTELGLPAEARLLVNVAMLVDHKGQTWLLKALPAILARLPDLVCVIVGEGELRQVLEAEAHALGLGNHVVFAGFRSDPLRCIALGDVFAMTSHMEGLCTSILDALGLGRPVVATRAGGIPEIIQHGVNGLLAASKDPADIAAQVVRMFEDEALRQSCVANGLATVRSRFSVDAMVEGTLGVYAELAAGPGQHRRD